MLIRLGVVVAAVLLAATGMALSGAHATATAITPNGSWPVYHHDDGHTGSQPASKS
jgi:hypothetical protein